MCHADEMGKVTPKDNVLSAAEEKVNAGKQESEVEISSVERLFTPLTHWVEEKIQQLPVVKPTAYTRQRKQDTSGITLREAIKLARKQYQGTVLSAAEVEGDKKQSFEIKILSAEGIVKTVSVDSFQPAISNHQKTSKENNEATLD